MRLYQINAPEGPWVDLDHILAVRTGGLSLEVVLAFRSDELKVRIPYQDAIQHLRHDHNAARKRAYEYVDEHRQALIRAWRGES